MFNSETDDVMESATLEKNNNNLSKVDEVKYDDDFEKDIEYEGKSELLPSSNKSSESDDDKDVITSTSKRIVSPIEIIQQQKLATENERTFDKPSDTDSEPETDVYSFTEDQKRAMMELMAQKQEDGDLLDEEPPEYNVKGRLVQLNAELANDPTPLEKDREHRVGFKPEIVDLVAPPPDYSDDESQPSSVRQEPNSVGQEPNSVIQEPNSIKQEPHNPHTTAAHNEDKGNEDVKDENKENVVELNKKQFVIERDGQFTLLSANELLPSERELFINEDVKDKKIEKQSENEQIRNKSHAERSHSAGKIVTNLNTTPQVLPRPPSWPRPHTAASAPRRTVHQVQSLQTRPANNQSINSSSFLDSFNYNSPYAMSHDQKEEAREKARRIEEERKEIERKFKEEVEERKRENDSAFQAWLCKKNEEDKRRHGADGERQKSDQERPHPQNGRDRTTSSDIKREENEDAYKTWLKEKKAQVKKDKLLKRRQQQEKVDGLVLRSPEECDEAFKEWLKKKNDTSKKQISMERQTNRLYKIQVKRSRKIQALVKAMKESQTSRYVDYYGYRF